MKPCTTLAKFALVSTCAMLLTACVSSQMPISPANDDVDAAPPPPTVAPGAANDDQSATCDLAAVQYAVGESFDEAKVSQLQSESSARRVRVLRPGDMATMDHRPDRLNIHLDEQDMIEELRCG